MKPNIYCKGKDYKNFKDDITGEILNETKELKKINGKVFYTDELTFSSSKLINKSTNFFLLHKKKLLIELQKTQILKKLKKK